MKDCYFEQTWYANDKPWYKELHIFLSIPDWEKFKNQDFYPDLIKFLRSLEE